MARAAVFNLLANDTILHDEYGIDATRVWSAHALDTAPRDGYFLILRWEEKEDVVGINGHGPEFLTVWCHISRHVSKDFSKHKKILERVRQILSGAVHVPGEDGTLTQVDMNGMSADFSDDGYDTITKNAAFRILSR